MGEKGDPQKAMEAMEMLARGPKGEQGTQGEPGERGLSRIQGRAVVVLFLIAALAGAGNLYWTAHAISTNNHKFCQVITTVVPVPRPADPKANPSRETAYEQYVRFAGLGRSLGC
jgi:hypothetical protein